MGFQVGGRDVGFRFCNIGFTAESRQSAGGFGSNSRVLRLWKLLRKAPGMKPKIEPPRQTLNPDMLAAGSVSSLLAGVSRRAFLNCISFNEL